MVARSPRTTYSQRRLLIVRRTADRRAESGNRRYSKWSTLLVPLPCCRKCLLANQFCLIRSALLFRKRHLVIFLFVSIIHSLSLLFPPVFLFFLLPPR